MTLRLVTALYLAILLPTAVAQDARAALDDLLKSDGATPPAWRESLTLCPADHMPDAVADGVLDPENCLKNHSDCSQRCSTGDGVACLSLALVVQEYGGQDAEDLYESLFFQACKGGAPSGCTNRAAAMLAQDFDCAVRTFEKTCGLEDPWGCTMLGSFLALGKGMPVDLPRARRVLQGSCKYGESDPACSAAIQILQSVDGAGDPADGDATP